MTIGDDDVGNGTDGGDDEDDDDATPGLSTACSSTLLLIVSFRRLSASCIFAWTSAKPTITPQRHELERVTQRTKGLHSVRPSNQ